MTLLQRLLERLSNSVCSCQCVNWSDRFVSLFSSHITAFLSRSNNSFFFLMSLQDSFVMRHDGTLWGPSNCQMSKREKQLHSCTLSRAPIIAITERVPLNTFLIETFVPFVSAEKSRSATITGTDVVLRNLLKIVL